ncbi:hypothetical protein L484_004355 [Morus notabilis]|uniref:Protein phosphatase n=1 Tax=Morus notabilis TaxID=981085 RepID=W9QWC5_9ROSA|nr:hypothetical protein L484_004355 [Morus notabilis]
MGAAGGSAAAGQGGGTAAAAGNGNKRERERKTRRETKGEREGEGRRWWRDLQERERDSQERERASGENEEEEEGDIRTEVEAAETAKESNEERPCKRLRIVIKKKGLKGEPLKPLGKDAYFVANEEQTIGVVDGVGRWARKGIDSGEYARELMKNSMAAVIGEAKEGSVPADLKSVLQEAFSKTILPGASTACILTRNEGVLRAITACS